MHYNEIKELSRKFRKNPTPEKLILWQYLRKRKRKGKKFLRQYPVIYENMGTEYFFFIADCYCATEKLIIELDGPVHDRQKERDIRRDEILIQEGYRILRIKNEELKNMEKVLQKIEAVFLYPPLAPP